MNMNTLTVFVLSAFLFALIPSVIIGGLVSLIHHDAGVYVGIFIWGMVFTAVLENNCEYEDDGDDEGGGGEVPGTI